jgi:hypothetical protein
MEFNGSQAIEFKFLDLYGSSRWMDAKFIIN